MGTYEVFGRGPQFNNWPGHWKFQKCLKYFPANLRCTDSKWGAILVAGYDKQFGKVFEGDINKFREVITSKFLPAMCL
ncbi:hypothetical protein DPMN_064873, partial [Dreissena polymorpha]